MAVNFGGRRDPQDPTIPTGGYSGDGEGSPQTVMGGFGFDPNAGERPRRPGATPPPPLTTWPPQNPEEYCRLVQHAVLCAIEHPFVRGALGKLMEEMGRSYVRPVSTPPWVHPPFNSVPIGGSGTVVVAAGGAYSTIVQGFVPRGYWGVIRQLAQDTQNVAAGTGSADWASLLWDFAIAPGNSTGVTGTFVSVPAYNDFLEQRGQIEAPVPAYLFVPEGHWFRLRAKATAAGPYTVAGLAIGWRWLIRGGRLDGSAKGVMGD